MRAILFSLVLALLPAAPAAALEVAGPTGGEVRVPLADYTQMLQQLADDPRPAPAGYAIGQARVRAQVAELEGRITAQVTATFQVRIFEDEWTLVHLLPPGVALSTVSVQNQPVELIQTPEGLAWSSNRAGSVTMALSYSVDARQGTTGIFLPLPLPQASATSLELLLPEAGLEVAIVPSANQVAHEAGDRTRITANVPTTPSVLVTWRAPSGLPYAISRAHYSGTLEDDALVWSARYQVEIFGEETVDLPLMPISVTLSDLQVDGETATVIEDEGFFATRLKGRGSHEVTLAFQVPVANEVGPPRAQLAIPKIPVSQFELALPGRKELEVTPATHVTTREADEETLASLFIPMSESVVFTWTEAVPEDVLTELRANASLYHRLHAEEGVLHGHASVVYEITRGETSRLSLEIPEDAQVNRVATPAGMLSDWTVVESENDGYKRIELFLALPVEGNFLVEVDYERLLGIGAARQDAFDAPLLRADEVHRQRGMVALLSAPELELKPLAAERLSEVGENQLPAFVRDAITMTVAHTYKYTDLAPQLRLEAVPPLRKAGRFDAQVDTLISLGEVTMKGSASVEIDVKSGSIGELTLALPLNVNLLGVTGPSLRSQEVREEGGTQLVDLEFTREMEGQFRLEVAYERIMEGGSADSEVPTVTVREAEVEHGRIAIEALSAVEIRASTAQGLSTLDVNELPRQLLLKTTNPILLAYRYVQARPPFKLVLTITRHREIEVQVAAIEQAHYGTLVTRDGLAVTAARLTVRNSRRQFLRLALPADSQVWSVFVDGKPEKPAFAQTKKGEEATAVLIRLINADKGFPVEIVYATPVEAIGHLGGLSTRLPRPDMVVTHSRWDLFLPPGPHYREPDSNLDPIVAGRLVNPRQAGAEVLSRASDAYKVRRGEPLRINVPTRGIQFSFEKLYASQSPEDAEVTIGFVSEEIGEAGLFMSALGVILVWTAILALGWRRIPLERRVNVALLLLGIALLILSLGYLAAPPLLASALALVIALILTIGWAVRRWQAWRQAPAAV